MLLTGIQFDISYVIKARAGFRIAEMAGFLNYFSRHLFAF